MKFIFSWKKDFTSECSEHYIDMSVSKIKKN